MTKKDFREGFKPYESPCAEIMSLGILNVIAMSQVDTGDPEDVSFDEDEFDW